MTHFSPVTEFAADVPAGTPLRRPLPTFRLGGASVWARLFYIALLFSLELVLIPVVLGQTGLALQAGFWGPPILRGAIVFSVVFAAFSWLRYKPDFAIISRELKRSPISLPALAGHLGLIAIFTLLSSALLKRGYSVPLGMVWLTTGLSAIVFGAITFIRPVYWQRIVRQTGRLWLWSTAAALLVLAAKIASLSLWAWTNGITFRLCQVILKPFVSGLIVDPANMVLGNHRFSVLVTPQCSGLEGVMLVGVFGIAWLGISRKECRFPQALLLVPAGIAMVFLLNTVRIAALVLIGISGGEKIAVSGFHSQAGWIVFNLVALGFIAASRRLPWFTVQNEASALAFRAQAAPRVRPAFENPTKPWLLPFVAILAAGMVSAAATADFEWLYPLRFVAGAVALACFWRRYKTLDWRVGWFAPVAGLLVFLIWIGLGHASSAAAAMPAPLAAASPLLRRLWIIGRILAAVVTAPIAEELAFRGFLYRRLLAADFNSVSLRRFSWLALLVSSAIFGILHGDRWFVGTLAGVIYGWVFIRRGRLGEAVAAHAITNALLAVDVLVFHHWGLW